MWRVVSELFQLLSCVLPSPQVWSCRCLTCSCPRATVQTPAPRVPRAPGPPPPPPAATTAHTAVEGPATTATDQVSTHTHTHTHVSWLSCHSRLQLGNCFPLPVFLSVEACDRVVRWEIRTPSLPLSPPSLPSLSPLPLPDIHTEAVQAALAKHKEEKMALPMPTKRRSAFVQSPVDNGTPPGTLSLRLKPKEGFRMLVAFAEMAGAEWAMKWYNM